MNLVPAALAFWIIGGVAALILYRRPRLSPLAAVFSLGAGVAILSPGVIAAMRGAGTVRVVFPWAVPAGEFALRLDALSAWFLAPTLVLSLAAAVYGVGYFRGSRDHRNPAPCWFFLNLLVASMTVVLTADNALLFLTAWEVMALASFFLVTFEDGRASVRKAGWIYLVATHLGTCFVLAFFLLLGRSSASLSFGDWAHAGALQPPLSAGLLFLIALVGFGAKAGIMPFHVWLPEAHPAAPSHVSAIMSGVMIKTGIYGLLRASTFLGNPPAWWGGTLLVIGVVSGILGVLFALAQHDLKRLLAYHSVENIGIIVIGFGMGQLGRSLGISWLAALGYAGCLLHVLNHALFKGLLFLGAGSVLKGAGSGEMDRLGGLLRRMPWTGAAFLTGAIAICGLPPLNGFVSEMLLFSGGLAGIERGGAGPVLAGLATVAGLALISGLAVACFTKAFGITFLGEPRGAGARDSCECPWSMRVPMLLLAAACAAVGLTARWLLPLLEPAVSLLSGLTPQAFSEVMSSASSSLSSVLLVCALLIGCCGLLAILRAWLLRGRAVSKAVTWDCGFVRPDARMQYTASSFAQPVTELFAGLLRSRVRLEMADGLFPASGSFESETPDPCLEPLFGRLFRRLEAAVSKMRWLQHGNIHLYILYIGVTLVLLLFWMMD